MCPIVFSFALITTMPSSPLGIFTAHTEEFKFPRIPQDKATQEKLALLRGMLKDADDQVREKAIRQIAALGPDAVSAVDDLADLLAKDKAPSIRVAAASAIDAIYFRKQGGAPSKHIVAVVADALKDQDTVVRWSAAETLRTLGRRASDAAPQLLQCMNAKDDPQLRELARNAFVAVVGPECKELAPKVLSAYRSGIEDPQNEFAVIIAIGRIGENAAECVPMLAKVLNDKKPKNERSRDAAMLALGDYGPKANSALPAIIVCLEESLKYQGRHPRNLRNGALSTIERIGPQAVESAWRLLSKTVEDISIDRGFRRDVEKVLKRHVMKSQK